MLEQIFPAVFTAPFLLAYLNKAFSLNGPSWQLSSYLQGNVAMHVCKIYYNKKKYNDITRR